jgi:hypothetical protein
MRLPRLTTAKLATILVALVGVLAAGAGSAFANDGLPAPVITSHPAVATTATAASFAFTESQSGASFRCSLDGGAFTACTSPKSYTGLTAGSHVFTVVASSRSVSSDATSYAWSVDQSPPAIALAFPWDGGSYNAAGWAWGCAGLVGVCGVAVDPAGVSSVEVSVRQGSGNWWGGSSFNQTSEFFSPATIASFWQGTAIWFLPLALPPDGSYTVHVRATDGLGNVTPSGSYTTAGFTIDTQTPPAPTISAKPASLSNSSSPSFSFGDSQAGVTFLCKLDAGESAPCASPASYSGLPDGSHTFQVQARDAAGNVSSPVSWTWTIDTKPPPTPTITQHVTDPTGAWSVSFSFVDSEAGVSFECQLDSGSWTACSSPTTYTGLSQAEHNFYVRAVDPAGNRSAAAHFEFDVTVQKGAPFTVTGNASGMLYPGAPAVPIAAKLANPNPFTIYVTSLAATLGSSGLPAGCNASWFQIAQSNVSTTNAVTVPANGSVTLPAQGVSAPTIQMIESNTVQDACENAKLTFSYTGGAHS